MNTKLKYRVIKSDKNKHESGSYQLLELYNNAWRCCGVYRLKRDAVKEMNSLIEKGV